MTHRPPHLRRRGGPVLPNAHAPALGFALLRNGATSTCPAAVPHAGKTGNPVPVHPVPPPGPVEVPHQLFSAFRLYVGPLKTKPREPAAIHPGTFVHVILLSLTLAAGGPALLLAVNGSTATPSALSRITLASIRAPGELSSAIPVPRRGGNGVEVTFVSEKLRIVFRRTIAPGAPLVVGIVTNGASAIPASASAVEPPPSIRFPLYDDVPPSSEARQTNSHPQ